MFANDEIETLLQAVAAKDRTAFRALYNATAPKLLGVALRICTDRSMAEDAIQNAFVDIWRSADRYDAGKGTAYVWMLAITRNRSIDLVRRRGRLAEVIDDTAMNAEQSIGAEDTERMALTQCLGRLEGRSREMVLLAYHQGFSREELSARYDAPVNTIKTILRRGLTALRQCLEE
ncbi:MAG: sigma-70 family RNA polymerase sigma factor [Pikeienuella sp.]